MYPFRRKRWRHFTVRVESCWLLSAAILCIESIWSTFTHTSHRKHCRAAAVLDTTLLQGLEKKKTSLLYLLRLCSTNLFPLKRTSEKNCTHTFLYLTVALNSLLSHPSVREVDLGFIWLKTSEKVKLSWSRAGQWYITIERKSGNKFVEYKRRIVLSCTTFCAYVNQALTFHMTV